MVGRNEIIVNQKLVGGSDWVEAVTGQVEGDGARQECGVVGGRRVELARRRGHFILRFGDKGYETGQMGNKGNFLNAYARVLIFPSRQEKRLSSLEVQGTERAKASFEVLGSGGAGCREELPEALLEAAQNTGLTEKWKLK